MMQLREGSPVYSSDGQDVGRVKRVVMNPVTKMVSHVVIRQGFLFTEDKVLPVDLISSATADGVTLRREARDLSTLPKFEEQHYIPVELEDWEYDYEPLMWYPPVGVVPFSGYLGGAAVDRWPYREVTEQNIPGDTVAIRDGTKVISRDDQHVGDVERVFVDSQSGRATHIVISQGLVFKERKLIPSMWLKTVTENEVLLSVDSPVVDRLPAYEDQPQPR